MVAVGMLASVTTDSVTCYLREQFFLGVLWLELDLEAWRCNLSWVLPLVQTVLHHVTVLWVGGDERLACVLHLKYQFKK